MPLSLYPQTIQAQPKKIVAISAGKGGVGKSLMTTHLALALQKKGKKVGILDADLYGPSIRKMLGEGELPYKNDEGIIYPAEVSGIKTLGMSYFRQESDAVAVRAPMGRQILYHFLNRVNWGALDLLFVDFPPGTGDIQFNLCQEVQFSGAVVVTTPQEISLLDVRRAVDLFFKMKIPLVGVIENMSYFIDPLHHQKHLLFGSDGGRKLSLEYNIPLLGEIPLDPLLCKLADEGKSQEYHDDGVSLGQLFSELAQKILEGIKEKEKSPEGQIFQKDPFSLSIVWKDDTVTHLPLFEIQKRCPCAECRTEVPQCDESVQARRIEKVGHYAIRFNFTSGCSKGIYEFPYLKNMEKK